MKPIYMGGKDRLGSKAVRQTYGGYSYQSKLEARYAARLDQLKAATNDRDRVVEWRRQVGVDLLVDGKKITRHYIDFVVNYADGREEWVEVKGFETEVWILKSRLFQAIFPDRKYVVVKQV